MIVREVVREDYAAMVHLMRFTHSIPLSEETLEEMECQRNKKFPFLRRVAEIDGQIVGYAKSQRRDETRPVRFTLSVGVDPESRGIGIGNELYQIASKHAICSGAEVLRVQTAEGDSIATGFAERRGFRELFFVQSFSLDLKTFDGSKFEDVVRKADATGIHFIPFQDTLANRQYLYELTLELSQDIPNVRDDTPPAYEDWERATFQAPWSYPGGIIVAVDGDQWIGFATIGRLGKHVFVNSMTGVSRSHRGKGFALALKIQAIELARSNGGHELQTQNHGSNEAIRSLNQKLGYQVTSGWHTHERQVSS